MKNTSTPLKPHVFDQYACAALTGLLANPAIMTAVGAQAWINDTGAKLPRHIVNAAMGYATLAMDVRQTSIPKISLANR